MLWARATSLVHKAMLMYLFVYTPECTPYPIHCLVHCRPFHTYSSCLKDKSSIVPGEWEGFPGEMLLRGVMREEQKRNCLRMRGNMNQELAVWYGWGILRTYE